MMQNIELLRLQLNSLVTQARHDLYRLQSLNDETVKQATLQRIWDALSMIHFISELLAGEAQTSYQISAQQPVLPPSAQIPAIAPSQTAPAPYSQRVFTIEELATYNGKNGRPAYVAVGGIVYDVTNNRGWAAATHFGLTAGKEYSREFLSCHAGQPSILAPLPVVGRLA
ncbi:cytochrome b5 domain-containing protein [Terrilactibacillus sp. S3-3]|nr:cytochrome b5 domain-containing protein [Terrilactibacillus sp. S3-3]